jgi:hypothetical protein
LKFKIE